MAELAEIPGVVPVLESGIASGGDPYLVMPLYTGGSLQELATDGPVDWEQAAELTRSVA